MSEPTFMLIQLNEYLVVMFLLLTVFSPTFFTFILKLRCILCKSLFWGVSGLWPHCGDHKAKQSISKARCELLTGGALNKLYTHQCSFQILIQSIRVNQKIDSEMLMVSVLLVFSTLMAFLETYIPFLLFYIESDLPMADSCHTVLSASSWSCVIFKHCGVCWDLFVRNVSSDWHTGRELWPANRISRVPLSQPCLWDSPNGDIHCLLIRHSHRCNWRKL